MHWIWQVCCWCWFLKILVLWISALFVGQVRLCPFQKHDGLALTQNARLYKITSQIYYVIGWRQFYCSSFRMIFQSAVWYVWDLLFWSAQLSHIKPAFPSLSRDSCRAYGQDERDALHFHPPDLLWSACERPLRVRIWTCCCDVKIYAWCVFGVKIYAFVTLYTSVQF